MVDPANETIWANQKAIAALFGVTVPNISYHLGRIFKVASQFVCLGPGLQFKERPKLRLFLSTYADTLFGTLSLIQDYRSIRGLDLEAYQLHMRYILLDTVTGYRSQYHSLSTLVMVK